MVNLELVKKLSDKAEDLFEQNFKEEASGKLKIFNLTDQVVLALLTKSSKTFKAIRLISSGFGEDCICLARTIFENYLNVKYILEEESRSKLFIYHGFYDGFKKIDNGLLDGCERKDFDRIFTPEIKKQTEEIRLKERDRLKKDGIQIKNDSWSLRSMRDMAKEVGEIESYEKIYWVMCLYTHPTANTLRDYIKSNDDGLLFLDTPSTANVEEGLIIAIDFFLKLLRLICERFDIRIIDKLSELESELEQIISEA